MAQAHSRIRGKAGHRPGLRDGVLTLDAPSRTRVLISMPHEAPKFEQYRERYQNIKLQRDDGILTMTFHTGGGAFVWSFEAHEEMGLCFAEVSGDRDNKVVVMTGTGANYCVDINAGSFKLSTAGDWDHIIHDGRRLLTNLLDIEVPVAADSALFQDAPHFMSGVVP